MAADYTLSVEINGDASSMEKAFKKVSGALEDTKNKINEASSGAVPGIGQMAKSFGIAQLAVKGFSMAMGAISGAVDGAVSRVDTLNQFPKVLEQMGYKSEEAKASIKSLSNGIQGLPTTLDGIASTTQRMTTIMGDVPKATDATLALNDAFLASGASSESAGRGLEQYMQMLSAGKVDMQSWRTLQETMPYALDKTARAFGFTGKSATNDFYEALKKGNITMDQVTDKFVELNKGADSWHNTALEATKGIGTSMQNLQTAIKNGVANVIQSFNEWAESEGFGTISDNINKIKQKVGEAFGYISDHIPDIMDKVKEVAVEFQKWYERLRPLAPVILAVLAPLLAFKGIVSIAQGVTDGVNKITGAINGLGQGVEIIKGVPGAFSNLGTSLSGIASGIKGGISAIGGAFQGLWATLMANPIILIIAGIVAVVGVLIYCYKHFEGFRDFVNNVASSIKDFFVNAWNSIKETTVEIWTGIKDFFSGIWDGVTSTVTSVWDGVSGYLTGIWNGIVSIAKGLWEGIKLVIMTPILLVIDLVTGNFTQLQSDLQLIWDKIKETAGLLWEGIKTVITTVVATIKDGVIAGFELLKTTLSNIITGIQNVFSSVWNAIKNSVINIATGLVNGAISVFNGLKTGVQNIINKVKDIFNSLKSISLIDIGKKIMNGFLNGLKSAYKKVQDFIGGIGNWIREHKGPIQVDRKLLIPAGNAIMLGLNSGLNSGFDDVKSNVNSMGNTISSIIGTDNNLGFEFDLDDSGFVRTIDNARNIIQDFKEYAEKGFGLNMRNNVSNTSEMKRVVLGGTGVFNQDSNVENTGKAISTNGVQSLVVRELGDLNLTVTSEMDSREVARGTYKFTDEFLKRNQKIRERRRGELY